MTDRKCPKCNEIKELSSFYVVHTGQITNPWCRSCNRQYNQLPQNKSRAAKLSRERMRLKKLDPVYKEHYNAQHKKFYATYKQKDPTKLAFTSLKNRSKKAGVSFTVCYEDFTVPEVCPILNIPLDYRDRDHTPSFDKVVPKLGYIKGNVAIISNRANRMKQNATLEELEAIVSYVKSYV